MPTRVYSEQFVRAIEDSGLYIWPCPLGQRAIVRSVVASNPREGSSIVQVFVGGCALVHYRFQVGDFTVAWDLRCVAYAGENIQVYIGTDGPHVSVAGYLFDDDGQAPAAVDAMRELHGRAVQPLPT